MIIDWYNKGFIEVIPVAPPDVVIAEGVTSLKPANLGKAPGKPTPRGWVGFPDWLNFQISPTHCQIYDEAQCSVGLRSEKYPGIDIDVLDEDLSNEIAEIAREIFGHGFRRVGRHPKQLLMYATEEKIHKQVLNFVVEDIQQKVEILGVGSQYVVEGIHPVTRSPYKIEEIESLTPTTLTVISQEQVRKFLEKVTQRLDLYGIELGTQSSFGGRSGEKPREVLIAADMSWVVEAVDALPNTPEAGYDWDKWMMTCAAIKAATQGEEALGLELWMKFSAKVEHKPFDPDEAQGIWDRMKPPYEIGADWLFVEASKHGDFNYAKTLPHLLVAQARPVQNEWYPGSSSWVAEEFKYSVLNQLKVVLEWKTCIIRKTQNWEVDHRNVQTATAIKEFLTADIFPRLIRETEDPVQAHKNLSSVGEQKAILTAMTDSSYSLIVRADELDRNPDILNTANGKICLQTGGYIKETANDTSDISLCVTGVVPDFTMETPTWNRFLEDITGRYEETDVGVKVYSDPEMKKYLQVYAGYAATGHTNEHIFFLLHGKGGNGKSTFVKTLQDVLGDYADTVPGEMFCISRKDMSHYKSKFHGRRLIVSSEFGQRAVWDLGELKRLTGGDTLDARNLYKDPFKFLPTHTVLIATNTKPKIEYIDEAIKRRTRLIPFDFQLPTKKKDPHLQKKLVKEYPGILAWIIEGSMQWYQQGFPKIPRRVQEATDEYFGDNDLVGLWLDECTVTDEDAKAECDAVFKSWQLFLSQSKENPTTQTQFVELLKNHGVFKTKYRGKRYYKGIQLKSELSDGVSLN